MRCPTIFHIDQRRSSANQRGATLVVVLILLLLMTLLGLANLRGTLLEERMGANLLDRGLAFQAAEAALRAGEAQLAALPVPAAAFPAAGCVAGLCAAPTAGAADRWTNPAFVGWVNAAAPVAGGAAVQSQFFIENLGNAPNTPGCDFATPQDPQCFSPRFRISARNSAASRAQLILQSNFAP